MAIENSQHRMTAAARSPLRMVDKTLVKRIEVDKAIVARERAKAIDKLTGCQF
jgi:hypothetical protein